MEHRSILPMQVRNKRERDQVDASRHTEDQSMVTCLRSIIEAHRAEQAALANSIDAKDNELRLLCGGAAIERRERNHVDRGIPSLLQLSKEAFGEAFVLRCQDLLPHEDACNCGVPTPVEQNGVPMHIAKRQQVQASVYQRGMADTSSSSLIS